jgi:hypothetical protein
MEDTHATELLQLGYTVVPTPPGTQQVFRDLFMQALRELPEFLPECTEYACGGFSALGTPSSFHHPHIRHIRVFVYVHLLPLFRRVRELENPAFLLEHLVDRMLYRVPGAKVTRESVHRDTCPGAHAGDYVFGGWINLDATAQHFSAVPGSHTKGVNGGAGFERVEKAEVAGFQAAVKRIAVPPGHVLVFFENIVHEVEGGSVKHPMARLFTAFRLTTSPSPLVPDIARLLSQQAVIPLKSGQVPPMFPRLHLVNHQHLLQQFTRNSLRAEYRMQLTVKSGKRAGQVYDVPRVDMVTRAMHPPQQLLYPAYEADEVALYTPHAF